MHKEEENAGVNDGGAFAYEEREKIVVPESLG